MIKLTFVSLRRLGENCYYYGERRLSNQDRWRWDWALSYSRILGDAWRGCPYADWLQKEQREGRHD